MTGLGKLLLFLGGIIVAIGAVLLIAGRFNLPLGRLPGDFVYRNGRTVVYIPLGTCLLLSIILSLGFWLYHRIR
ncbi:MAG TPA: DUF2905 domain-containing protein [Candidatus Angelobacter sp.]|nr:DUF2905 domain-containing protein [Candidatus Angelobacter sp.]